jgi:hypothetical protein
MPTYASGCSALGWTEKKELTLDTVFQQDSMTPICSRPKYLSNQLKFKDITIAYLNPYGSLWYMLFCPRGIRRVEMVRMGELSTELYISSTPRLRSPPSTLINEDVPLGTRYLAYA